MDVLNADIAGANIGLDYFPVDNAAIGNKQPIENHNCGRAKYIYTAGGEWAIEPLRH